MSNPLVSVILPVFNYEDYLLQAIESVLIQSFRDFELIIVDDCSTDDSLKIIDDFLFYKRIKLIHNTTNLGVAKSRNRALKVANGKYIAFLDADDYWHPDKLQRQVWYLEGNKWVDILHTGVTSVLDSITREWLEKVGNFSPSYWDLFFNDKFIKQAKNRTYFSMLSYGDPICWSSVIVRKEVIDFIEGFDEELLYQNEDWIFLLKCSLFFNINFIPDRLTFYRVHEQSYSAITILSGGKWDANTAIGQAHDRVAAFAKRKEIPCSYRKFDEDLTIKQKIKRRLQLSKNIKKRIEAKLKDNYHRNEHWLNPIIKKNEDADLLILFVTSKCNFSCSHCFYDADLNRKDDLSLKEIKLLANTFPAKLNNVTLTGGEPFLRKDFKSIICTFLNYSNVWINTNGYYPQKIKNDLTYVLKKNYKKQVTVSVSIDGFEATHNKIRGDALSYERALASLRVLLLLKKSFPNLSVMINTTITDENIGELYEFAKEISYGFPIDYHNFEIERLNKYERRNIQIYLKGLYDALLKVIAKQYPEYYLVNKAKFKLQYNNLVYKKNWSFSCLAGEKGFVVYPNGQFAACEMREPIFNVKTLGCHMDIILGSKILKNEIESIKKDKCYCTHGCWLATSMLDHFKRKGWRSR